MHQLQCQTQLLVHKNACKLFLIVLSQKLSGIDKCSIFSGTISFDDAGARYLVVNELMTKLPNWCFWLAAVAVVLAAGRLPAVLAHDTVEACPAGTGQFTEYRLYFGRSRADAEVVNDEAWDAFLANEITPRFPAGLTVLDAAGQWRDSAGTIVRERSKLVVILTGVDDAGLPRTDQVVQAYKETFAQEAVLRTVATVCASF